MTGAFQAWREVAPLPALYTTAYGRLLLVKLAVVGVLLAPGDQGRRWIRRGPPVTLRGMRGSVAVEVGVGVVVLALTTMLVSTPPARRAYDVPFSATLTVRSLERTPITVVVVIFPTRTGPQTVGLTIFRAEGGVLPFVRGDRDPAPGWRRDGPGRV